MKEYIARRVSAVHVIDATGNEVPSDLLDSLGISLITNEPVSPPTLGPAIADRTYVVGSAPVTIDLSQRFLGAISYGMSPTNIPGVTRSGAIVTIDPATTRPTTAITVTGTNTAGTATMTFNLTVNAVSPTSTAALPDRSLTVGDAAVTLTLGDYFANAASYSVSPTGQGVSISGSTMTISAAAERNGTYTVTASNSTGQTVSDAFALTVVAAPAAPAVTAQPTISGGNTQGVILNSTTGTASGNPTPTAARQWLADGVAVSGATSATFDTAGRGGQSISLRVTWTNGVGSPAVATSAPVAIAAPAASPLQQFYTSGTIGIHFRREGVSPAAGPVTAIVNHGGAGSVFNASVVGTAIPLTGNYLEAAASSGYPMTAAPADLVGVRLMWVMRMNSATGTYRFFGRAEGSDSTYIRTNVGTSIQMFRVVSGVTTSANFTGITATTAARLLEIEVGATTARLFINGSLFQEVSITFPTFRIDRLTQGPTSLQAFEGGMGDVLGVVTGQSDTTAAIASARYYLDQRFSLGLGVPQPAAPAMSGGSLEVS